ncbi:accessory gene regulator B family protein [Lysinibacillus sphaericus]|uniref:accessory gene regulator ArgB-like protein n=1 Tax=Lysinibacillus sphaericus TaxID=1421 RepID=UPI001E4A1926|nr:accessory gene regulator B family protein [Lysinibacillus sphaericus]UDK96045.1 accessory gene regulator B family protein [Lysinibacillus sphaericus]
MEALLKLENIITKALIQENHNEIEKEKIRFGIQLIVNDIWKILFIYIVAFLLNCFMATLITHITFIVLRQVSFGFHFQSSIICLVASIVSLPIGLYIIDSNHINADHFIFLIGILSTLFLLLIAPVGTTKRPVFNQNHRNYLRKQLFIRLSILWTIIFVLKGDYQLFILYAINLLAISVLIQKIFGGSNYEN